MNFWKVFGASLLAVVVASVASSILSLIFMVGLSSAPFIKSCGMATPAHEKCPSG